MTQQIPKQAIDGYRKFQKSPLFFVEKMWGLVPQPLKPEYVERIKTCPLEEVEVFWFEDFMPGKHLTWQQYLLFVSVERALAGNGSRKIAIESGQGVGKTAAIAMLIIWFVFCFKEAIVPCTAPTIEQMYDALWRELALWHQKMPQSWRGLFEWSSQHFRVKQYPETWYARARTGRKENPEALAGVHAPHILTVCDEASGIPDEVYQIGEGLLAGDNVIVILFSQHTRLAGYFHECFNKDKKNWQRLRFNSLESPIVNAELPNRIAEKYGKDSDAWRVQILGQSPASDAVDSKGYVPLLTVQDIRQVEDSGFIGMVKMGIDPSGQGSNDTVWVIRDRFKGKITLREPISTPKSIAQRTLSLMLMYGVTPENIWIDNFGVGANVAQELAFAGKRVNAVNVGDKPFYSDDKERFLNMRSVVYWRLREWLRGGGELVKHKNWEQLLIIKYKPTLSGHIKIMSKDEMKKEGYESPDDADALSLTFWEVDPVEEYKEEINNEPEEGFDPHSYF